MKNGSVKLGILAGCLFAAQAMAASQGKVCVKVSPSKNSNLECVSVNAPKASNPALAVASPPPACKNNDDCKKVQEQITLLRTDAGTVVKEPTTTTNSLRTTSGQ